MLAWRHTSYTTVTMLLKEAHIRVWKRDVHNKWSVRCSKTVSSNSQLCRVKCLVPCGLETVLCMLEVSRYIRKMVWECRHFVSNVILSVQAYVFCNEWANSQSEVWRANPKFYFRPIPYLMRLTRPFMCCDDTVSHWWLILTNCEVQFECPFFIYRSVQVKLLLGIIL